MSTEYPLAILPKIPYSEAKTGGYIMNENRYITKESLIAHYISGAPVDLVHAVSTVIFLWVLSRPLLEKLERIKRKYGLIQD